MSITLENDQKTLEEIRAIADDVAAANAETVDREARFPHEAIDALREKRALSALVPSELGGEGVSLSTIATACFELGRRCAATGMVFAMHQIQVASMVRHLDGSPWYQTYLQRLSTEQRLIASVTSEIGTGGDMGSSVAALEPGDGERLRFSKQAPTVSYGGEADDLFVTLRRASEAEPGDQVIALAHDVQLELEQTGAWDPMGMRGTCSPPFVVSAEIEPGQVLDTPFTIVSAKSMVPISHILWSHLWLGVATDAFDRARAFTRAAAKRTPGQPPASAQRLSHLMSELTLLRSVVGCGLRDFEEADHDSDGERLSTMSYALATNNLKIAASEQTVRVCRGALDVCGIMGFKNDSPFSVARHVRDSMSGPLMVANERIHRTDASLLLIAKDV